MKLNKEATNIGEIFTNPERRILLQSQMSGIKTRVMAGEVTKEQAVLDLYELSATEEEFALQMMIFGKLIF